MTTVSNPNSNPPRAPDSVAFIRLEFGRIVSDLVNPTPSYRLPGATVKPNRPAVARPNQVPWSKQAVFFLAPKEAPAKIPHASRHRCHTPHRRICLSIRADGLVEGLRLLRRRLYGIVSVASGSAAKECGHSIRQFRAAIVRRRRG